ncbi:MAG: cupredoxin domain-containing protein [Candidatus Daviesbacteria bacterium]|nr:cupredoxin domain-containing protein [Candidatus Daviesbacteria bacterium]
MNNKVLIAIVVIIILLGLGYFLSQSGNRQQVTQPAPVNSPEQATSPATPAAKTFDVTGTPFQFEPNEIKVKKGDTVRINFKNMEGTLHDLTIADLNVRTKQIPAGQTDSIEFVADTAGTFDFICSVPTHADRGMVGKFIVEE